MTGIEHQADLFCRFDDFKRHDRNNPFTVEEYYFLRNNLPSLPESSVKAKLTTGLNSVKSLAKQTSQKRMRESMK